MCTLELEVAKLEQLRVRTNEAERVIATGRVLIFESVLLDSLDDASDGMQSL